MNNQTNSQMSDSINELATALAIAQGQMENAKKDSDNPFFKSKYADLSSVITAAKKPLSENGLAVVQTVEPQFDVAQVTTILLHKSGQWIKSTVALKPTATTPQAMGSAITYARRYGYQAVVGLSAEDDDGASASKSNGNHSNGSQPQATAQSGLASKCAEQATEICANLKGVAIPQQVMEYSNENYHRTICWPCQEFLKKQGKLK